MADATRGGRFRPRQGADRSRRRRGRRGLVGIDIAYRLSNAPVTRVAGSGFQAMHILVNALIAEQARHADVFLRPDLHPLMEGRKEYRQVPTNAGEEAVEAAWARIIDS